MKVYTNPHSQRLKTVVLRDDDDDDDYDDDYDYDYDYNYYY